MRKFALKIFNFFVSELKRIFTDPGSLLILVGAAIMYSSAYSLPYATEVIVKVPIGVCDYDDSELSKKYLEMTAANPYLNIVSRPLNLETAKQEINRQKIYAFVVLPEHFGKDITAGKNVNVSVYTDSGYLIVYRQVMSNINLINSFFAENIKIHKLSLSGFSAVKIKQILAPAQISEMPLFNPSGGYESYIFPAVLILILQQTMLVGVGLLTGTDRENGFFTKLDNADIIPCVIGRALSYTAVYTIHSLFYFIIVPKLYGYSFYPNLHLLPLMMFPYLLSVAFLSQALTIFYKTRESSLLAIVVLSLPLAFLPGIIWPKEAIPAILRNISLLLPSTSAMDGIVKINQMGAGFSEIWFNFVITFFLCILYFICAVKVYKILNYR